MKLFAIYAPRGAEAVVGAGGLHVARTGFSLAALLFGPLWLLARGAWWALLAYLVAEAALFALVGGGALRPGAAIVLLALGHLYLGLEGRALAMAARERGHRPLVDVVYAGSALEAEKVYLERALRSPPASRSAVASPSDVIGLFPEPGR